MKSYLRGFVATYASYWRIAALLPKGGAGLVGVMVGLNVVLGLLPVAFIVATSVMIGRVPAAVTGGVGSGRQATLSHPPGRSTG